MSYHIVKVIERWVSHRIVFNAKSNEEALEIADDDYEEIHKEYHSINKDSLEVLEHVNTKKI